MELLARLLDPTFCPDITLEGYRLPYLRGTAAWDTGVQCLDRHLLYLLDGGRLHLECGGQQQVVDPSSLICLAPGQAFRMRAVDEKISFWRVRVRLPVAWAGPVVIPQAGDLLPLVMALVAEIGRTRPYHEARVRGLLLALFAGMAGARGAAAEDVRPVLDDRAMQMVVRHVVEDPLTTPRDLARLLGYSLDYFTRRFHDAVGCAPRHWLMEQRLLGAATALTESQESAAAIAQRFGFADPRRFTRRFRARFGMTPGRYRTTQRVAAEVT